MGVTRIVFMGTPEFAVPSLRLLLRTPGVEMAGVVTQPDRPSGRGRHVAASPIKQLALQEGLPLLQPGRLRDNPAARGWMARLHPDLSVVVAFGQLLPAEIFDLPPHGTLNVHASLLPKYRGAAPIPYALLEGESFTGVSIMRIEAGLDSGPVVGQEEVAIGEDETTGELEPRLAQCGAELLVRLLKPYLRGERSPRPQAADGATFAPSIRREDARIDWSGTARRVHNQIRAFNPRPGAFTEFRGQILKLWRSRLSAHQAVGEAVPGRFFLSQGLAHVVCGDGRMLELVQVQPANRKRLSGRDFANGFRLSDSDLCS